VNLTHLLWVVDGLKLENVHHLHPLGEANQFLASRWSQVLVVLLEYFKATLVKDLHSVHLRSWRR
jgi:hypothetical protein